MKKIFLLFVLSFTTLTVNISIACTTAVISGKCTSDGRAIMWKLRDAGERENCLRFFNDGKYTYIGLINSNDPTGEQVWGGSNSMGFSIMNNASYNVNLNDTSSLKDQEGRFMKLALQTCATLQDFEHLLDTYPKPSGLAANIGVIDAQGGAAYYEVTNYTWTKFDANDVAVAPEGYLIRTNFSLSGKKDAGYGYVRFQTAQEIFKQAYQKDKFNYTTVIQEFSRCLYQSVLNENYREKYKTVPYGKHFIVSDDLITRNSSVSSIVVQGVKAGEPTDLTTIWSMVGYPNTCISIPVWIRGGKNLPGILEYNPVMKTSPLNKAALEWKVGCYSLDIPEGSHYLNVSALINKEGKGFIQRIEPVEKEIFAETEKKLDSWRVSPATTKDITDYYAQLTKKVIDLYHITY